MRKLFFLILILYNHNVYAEIIKFNCLIYPRDLNNIAFESRKDAIGKIVKLDINTETNEIINKSNYNIKNIKKIIFFPSDRIDIVLENKKKIRFPINLTVDNLNFSLQLVEDDALNDSKIIDLRIPSKVITYE